MHRILLAAGAAALLWTLASTPAGAFTNDPGAIRPAIGALDTVEKTACWRWGWHGWGWYPCYRWGWGPGYYHRWGWGPRWGYRGWWR
jgi:hypothetical protein